MLQMMWIGCLFCIPLQNMCWIAFAFSTTYTNSPYCKRKAISSMWFETFGFINRLLDFHNFILHSLFLLFTFRFISFCLRFVGFVLIFTCLLTWKFENLLACDNGLCEQYDKFISWINLNFEIFRVDCLMICISRYDAPMFPIPYIIRNEKKNTYMFMAKKNWKIQWSS